MTFHAGIQQAVYDACPEITEVVEVRSAAAAPARNGPVSPFAPVNRAS
jgi:hypothetical protein